MNLRPRILKANKKIARAAARSGCEALLRLSAVYNLPMACNAATADFLFSSPFMEGEYQSVQTDYSKYLKRQLPDVKA